MGTRGLIMVVKDGETKVAQYAQFDMYASGQGLSVLAFVRKLALYENLQIFKDAIVKCFFIDEDELNRLWATRKNDTSQYPQLTRDTGSDILELIVNNKDDTYPLENSDSFANESLFCEWLYLIDLDKNTLEAYEGFNSEPPPETNRFQCAGKESNGGTTYYPVVLKAEWQLDNLPSNNEFINKLNPPDEDEEQDEPEDKNFMKDKVTYLLVKVDTDQDIETIVGHIETLENNLMKTKNRTSQKTKTL